MYENKKGIKSYWGCFLLAKTNSDNSEFDQPMRLCMQREHQVLERYLMTVKKLLLEDYVVIAMSLISRTCIKESLVDLSCLFINIS